MGVLCWSLFWYSLLCVLSSFAITLTRKRGLVALLLLSYCKCFVALPHCAVGWSAVCGCDISCSYSLTFWFPPIINVFLLALAFVAQYFGAYILCAYLYATVSFLLYTCFLTALYLCFSLL